MIFVDVGNHILNKTLVTAGNTQNEKENLS